jgi:hypothetical protein
LLIYKKALCLGIAVLAVVFLLGCGAERKPDGQYCSTEETDPFYKRYITFYSDGSWTGVTGMRQGQFYPMTIDEGTYTYTYPSGKIYKVTPFPEVIAFIYDKETDTINTANYEYSKTKD